MIAVSGRGAIHPAEPHLVSKEASAGDTSSYSLAYSMSTASLCAAAFPSISVIFIVLLSIYSTLCNFPCERPHRYYKTPPLMNRRVPDKRAAVLFILSWLAGSFNGNLNKLLNATMKLHLCIQCQCKDPPRIPVNSQIQPASLSFPALRFSCSLSYRWGIDRRGCRALEIISNRPGSHLLCPPARNHHPLPDLTALIDSSLPTQQ